MTATWHDPTAEPPEGEPLEVLMDDGAVESAAYFRPSDDTRGVWLHATLAEEPGQDFRRVAGWRVSR